MVRKRAATISAGVLVLVLATLGVVTNYATDSVPSWISEHQSVTWAALGVLLILAVGLEVYGRYADRTNEDKRLLGRVSVPPLRRGKLPQCRDVALADLGVHAPQIEIPFLQRDRSSDLKTAIGEGRAVLLTGHSMAGKSRMAAEAVKYFYPTNVILVARAPGNELRALLEAGWDPSGVVVWLDDLERFLTSDGVDKSLLGRLCDARAIVIATMRDAAKEEFRPLDRIKRPGWDTLATFTQIDLKRRLSENELRDLRALVNDTDVLAAVGNYGLAEYLGGGPVARDAFDRSLTLNPLGRALVEAAVDWRRAGLNRSVPRALLVRRETVDPYLAGRPDVDRSDAALEESIDWATEKINETVRLLTPNAVDADRPSLEAFDYIVDIVTTDGRVIPKEIWEICVSEAADRELFAVGVAAHKQGVMDIAERAWTTLAVGGDHISMFNAGLLADGRGDSDEAIRWLRRASDLGNSNAMSNLGLILDRAKKWNDAEEALRRSATHGNPVGMMNLSRFLRGRGEVQEAEHWLDRAFEYRSQIESEAAGGNVGLMANLGVLLIRNGDEAEGVGWLRRAADSGSVDAMLNLGQHLESRQQKEAAEEVYRPAASRGDREAAYRLGDLLRNRGAAYADEARSFIESAAHAGHPRAMNDLGALLLAGGKEAEADSWLLKSAEAGDLMATYNYGLRLGQNDKLKDAERWLRVAAERGHKQAMRALGTILIQTNREEEAEIWRQRFNEA